MNARLFPALLAVLALVQVAHATVSCPKTKAKVAKLISDKLSDDIIDQGCTILYNYVKNSTTYPDATAGLADALSDKVLGLTAFYGPALKLYTGLSDWKKVANQSLNVVKKVCKPYYVNKLLKKKPASMDAFDTKIAKWVIKKVVRGAMIDIKKVNTASDWKQILSALWTPVRFDNNGFSKP